MDVNDRLYTFLKNLNRTIIEDGEMRAFQIDMGSGGLGTSTYLTLLNYNTRDKFNIRTHIIDWESLDWYEWEENPDFYAVRIQDEEENFQRSTVQDVITIDTEAELRLALHNISTFMRDNLNLYDDVLWCKPYSDL